VPEPIATWNPARSVWETNQGMLCEHSDVFSGIWPSSGMTRGGVAYALPMWAPLTTGSGSSLLLGTPRTSSANGVGRFQDSPRGTRGRLEAQVHLLKTPLAVNGGSQHPETRKARGHGPTLADEIEHLLPTPTARDHKGHTQRRDETCLTGALLPSAVQRVMTQSGSTTREGSAPVGAEVTAPTPRSDVQLLPTPTAMDSGSSGGSTPSDMTLTDAVVRTRLGARTNPRFADGSTSTDQLLPLGNPDEPVSG